MIKVKKTRPDSRSVEVKGTGKELLVDLIHVGKELINGCNMPVELLDLAVKLIKLETNNATEDEIKNDIDKILNN